MSAGDRAAYLIATGFGAGFVPVAPGTVGAIEGIAIYLIVRSIVVGQLTLFLGLIILNIGLFLLGVWASTKTCGVIGTADPHQIVIDEISGQLIALTPLALLSTLSLPGLIIGFALFRVFDIFKPYPIRRLERLPKGFGVMADDALAGIYAAALLWCGQLFFLR
ncbi:MAG TPA: phosphatidylglycerophosphatase A [Blastocatellia bacterium]|nr:phosphatidylglycerophosphatase A [Blastocatellia bacterium]